MGKPTGFLEHNREVSREIPPKDRLENYDEFHEFLSLEKQQVQASRCMECGVSFCNSGMVLNGMTTGCPLNNLIPEWNDLLFKGNLEEAYKRLKKTNNFPEFTSRVCPSPCEYACTCGYNTESITIKENEHMIIETAYEKGYAASKPPKTRTDKKIAVIGGGPCGLAAADTLNKRGHNVTVFERNDRVGGLLMYGIPNMKLEKHIIDRKVKIMEEEGIKFELNSNVGENVKAADLLKEFDRVILSCGASNPRDINVQGRDAKGVYFAVDFLTSTTKSLLDNDLKEGTYISAKEKNVIVVGGGDTGNDCVGTSIRHGAKSVVQIEMMGKAPEERLDSNPWPEWPRILKTDYGQNEAIHIFKDDPRVYETTIKEFIKNDKGELTDVVTVKVKFADGKLQEVENSEKTIKADIVLIAAGFLGTQKYVADEFKVGLDARTNVVSNAEYETSIPNVYVAGDMRRGQSLVVWAIKEGRSVAKEVDKSLMGYSNI